ncbi:MAG: dihydrodipicolinate synthase family protein, partial [Deltaproteobacteria bacterium]|nr:dihydrodipicolinate synthase family protein [Deltaproteobacteria bacterium]
MDAFKEIRGIIPPMTTPFTDGGKVDEEALRKDVRYLVEEAGVHGLAVSGSTGEGHTVTLEETRLLTASAIAEAGGRVPVITGIIANSTREAIEKGKAVGDHMLSGAVMNPKAIRELIPDFEAQGFPTEYVCDYAGFWVFHPAGKLSVPI